MGVMSQLAAYFDLQSGRRSSTVGMRAQNLSVFPQYIALVAGIVIQPFLATFESTGSWDFSMSDLVNRSVFAVATGVLIFPAVYRRAFDPNQPVFVQWCAVFASGIGWKSLLGAAAKTALGGGG